ncbi:MAG: heat-inducible transcription repressor HrcA [Clostridia bacterium]|nr:heat-inducible transcription repressor HrcA [Clostridia bacterium]
MDMQDRKRRILKAIVENYIDTAEPVGSKSLATSFDRPISSATIRNEMSELEEMGYLEKPHVSAGRVPSYAAYRLYVNELMDRSASIAAEINAIRAELESKLRELDDLAYTASRVMSAMTNHTTVSAVKSSGVQVKKVELIPVDSYSYAAVLITDSEVKSRMFRLRERIDPSAAAMLGTAINLALAENRLEYLLPSIARSMGPEAPAFRLADSVLKFIGETEREGDGTRLHVEGAEKLLNMREYQDASKARELMEYLSDSGKVMDLLEEAGEMPISIKIGPELGEPRAKDASFVFTTYDIDRHTKGIIGIVAPTRMDYAKACAHLAAFKQAVRQLAPYTDETGDNNEYR